MKTIFSIRRSAPAAAFALALALFAVSARAAGGNYTLAWGDGTESKLAIPEAAFSNATQIAAGAYHTLAIVDDRVHGWGDTNNGALKFPAAIQSGAYSFIAAGYDSGLALNTNGVGSFWTGSDCSAFTNNCPLNTQPGTRWSKAALGKSHGLLLTDGGAVRAWGNPGYGTDYESQIPVTTPNQEWQSGFTEVAAGIHFSMGLSNGFVHVAAPPASAPYTNGLYNLLDIPEAAKRFAPGTRHGTVKAIAAGSYHAMALTTDGEVLVWGAWTDDDKKTDAATAARAPVPRGSFGYVTNVPPEATSNIVAIAAGENMCAALTDAGKVVVWGMASEVAQGYSKITDVPSYALQDVRQIALGYRHIVVCSAWRPPVIDGTALPEAHLGSEYSARIPVRADPSAKVTLGSGKLPDGISFANGVLSGTPTAMGTNTFTVKASNKYGSDTKSFTLVVADTEISAPVWMTASLPEAVVGFPYSVQLEATQSPTFTAVRLPQWATLSPGGLLSGTPGTNDVRTSYPEFTASNAKDSAKREMPLTVVGQSSNTPPLVKLAAIPDLLVGSPATIDLQIEGASSVTLSGDLAKDGFRIDSSDGRWVLVGKPSGNLQGTNRSAIVEAKNTAASATKTYWVNVNGSPVWRTFSLPPAAPGTPYSATVRAEWATSYTGPDSRTLAALGLSFDTATDESSQVVARFSGTPPSTLSVASTNLTVVAVNDSGKTSHVFTLSFTDTPSDPPFYRFLSIVPSRTNTPPTVTLSWTNLAGPDSTAIIVTSTNLLSDWPADTTGTVSQSPAVLPMPSSPAFFGLAPPP